MKLRFAAMLMLALVVMVGAASAYMGSGMGNSRYSGMSGGYDSGHNSMHGYGYSNDMNYQHNSMHNDNSRYSSRYSDEDRSDRRTRRSSRYGSRHNNYGRMHDYNTMDSHMNTVYGGTRGSMNNQDNRYGSRYSDEDRPRTSRYNQRTQRSSRNSWWRWN